MKPKPLDLEEIRKNWIEFDSSLNNTVGEFVNESGFTAFLEEDTKEFKERDEMITEIRKLVDEQLEILFDEIKQHLKSACEFYLRYKDNPDLLIKERLTFAKRAIKNYLKNKYNYPNISKIVSIDATNGGIICEFERNNIFAMNNEEYNEWLFKLAFKLEDDKKGD